MSNRNDKQPIIKNKRGLKTIAALSIAAIVVTGFSHCNKYDFDIADHAKLEQSYSNENLDFTVIKNFDGKDYLSLEEEDFLSLIRVAMKEVDLEYKKQGCTPVFDAKDSKFSLFDEYDILGIFKTESSYRLLELKDVDRGVFNVDNYARFFGEDKNNIIYYGPGMISADAVDYVVLNDRQQTNSFTNYNQFEIDGELIEISFKNLNPYDYVINSGAKTQEEIKQALKECIMLNAKCVYVTLNRFVKDYVKAGTHDAELEILNEYSQFKNLSQVDKQKAFALICYNNGGTKTSSKMLDKKLFEKNSDGEYVLNVSYAKKSMQNANDARLEFKGVFGVD